METAILGAGPVGLTLAMRLALAGQHVTLIEREQHPGGLAAGFPVGQVWLDKFYHHLFTTDNAILDLIRAVGLDGDLAWEMPDTSLFIHGRSYRLDSPRSVMEFSALPVWDRLRMGIALGMLRYAPSVRPFERTYADAWLRRWMGRQAYETAWKPQLVGKFGEHASEISLAWMWARTHDRSLRLGYLKGGFQRLYDRLAAIIADLGGDLRFGAAVQGITRVRDGRLRVTTADGQEVVAQRVISTLPTRVTLDLMPFTPTYYRTYNTTRALGAHSLVLSLDRPLSPVYWLAICDPGYPFLVAVEHTNMIAASEYSGRHLLYLGAYLPMRHPRFHQSKEQVLEEYLPALQRIYPGFRRAAIQESWMFAAPYAQPIVTPGYRERIPPHTTPIPGLYLVNMFQVYPHDRGQNYAVAMADAFARDLLRREEP